MYVFIGHPPSSTFYATEVDHGKEGAEDHIRIDIVFTHCTCFVDWCTIHVSLSVRASLCFGFVSPPGSHRHGRDRLSQSCGGQC